VRGIAMVTLDQADIVRHNLVQRIVEAYEPRRKPVPMMEHDQGDGIGGRVETAQVDAE
jgi:phosphate starvation-inducible protein PhoH